MEANKTNETSKPEITVTYLQDRHLYQLKVVHPDYPDYPSSMLVSPSEARTLSTILRKTLEEAICDYSD